MGVCIYLNRCIKRLISKSITKYTIPKRERLGSMNSLKKEVVSISLNIYIEVSLIVYIVGNCLSYKELNKRFPEWSRGTITIIRFDFIESP